MSHDQPLASIITTEKLVELSEALTQAKNELIKQVNQQPQLSNIITIIDNASNILKPFLINLNVKHIKLANDTNKEILEIQSIQDIQDTQQIQQSTQTNNEKTTPNPEIAKPSKINEINTTNSTNNKNNNNKNIDSNTKLYNIDDKKFYNILNEIDNDLRFQALNLGSDTYSTSDDDDNDNDNEGKDEIKEEKKDDISDDSSDSSDDSSDDSDIARMNGTYNKNKNKKNKNNKNDKINTKSIKSNKIMNINHFNKLDKDFKQFIQKPVCFFLKKLYCFVVCGCCGQSLSVLMLYISDKFREICCCVSMFRKTIVDSLISV